MKKISLSVMMVVAAALMAVACSKEEPKVAESRLVGTWKAPLSVGAGSVEGVGGKNLIINANHTASFAVLQFKNWKIEGDVLTFTNVADQGVNREMEVLRYTINNFTDSLMTLTGSYTYLVGDSIVIQGDMSGVYARQAEQPQQ